MSTFSNVVETVVKLRGGPEFQRQAKATAQSVGGIGKASEKTGKQAATSLKSMTAMAGGATLFAGAGLYMKKATNAAVDLNEQMNKVGVVFAGSSKDVVKWSKGSAEAMGISQNQALTAAGTFGNLLVPMGFARDRAADMSKRMVQLAGDMASFNNASPEQTLDAVRAGLAGEAEPLRRFGVFLSDARQKQEALNMGLYNGKGNLTASARAAATYALILKDTKDQQGDFQRTSGSLANQQKTLSAEFENLNGKLGAVLIPTLKTLAGLLLIMAKHTTTTTILIGVLAAAFIGAKVAAMALTFAQLGLTRAFVAQRLATIMATAAVMGLNASMLLIPALIAGAVIALVILYKKWEWFHRAVDNTFNFIKTHWPLMLATLVGPFGLVTLAIIKNMDAIKGAFGDAIHWIANRWRDLIGFVGRVVGKITAAAGAITHPGRLLGKLAGGLPFAASGGTVTGSGSAVVGERGPEVVRLPRAAQIVPLERGALAGAAGPQTVVTQVYLNKRQIAEAVGTYTSDLKARR